MTPWPIVLLIIASWVVIPCLYIAAMILLAFGFGGGYWWGFVGGFTLLLLVSSLPNLIGTN